MKLANVCCVKETIFIKIKTIVEPKLKSEFGGPSLGRYKENNWKLNIMKPIEVWANHGHMGCSGVILSLELKICYYKIPKKNVLK